MRLCGEPKHFTYAYELDQPIPDKIRAIVTKIYGGKDVEFTPEAEKQISQLISLCRSLEKLDTEALRYNVEYVQGTLNKVSGAKMAKTGFLGTVGVVIESVSSFFERIGRFLGL